LNSAPENKSQPHRSAATVTVIRHQSAATATTIMSHRDGDTIMSDRDGDGDADASMACWGPIKWKCNVIISVLDLLNYYKTMLGLEKSCPCQCDCPG
jgi:hypothetical protein